MTHDAGRHRTSHHRTPAPAVVVQLRRARSADRVVRGHRRREAGLFRTAALAALALVLAGHAEPARGRPDGDPSSSVAAEAAAPEANYLPARDRYLEDALRRASRAARRGEATRTTAPLPPPPRSRFVAPLRLRVTSCYGPRWGRLHAGLDVGARRGTPISTVAAGRVVQAGWYGGYGAAVVVDHGGGWATLYGHASRLLVTTGQRVAVGATIALVGSTGHSYGSHLHLGVARTPWSRDAPRWVDPAPWLRARGVGVPGCR